MRPNSCGKRKESARAGSAVAKSGAKRAKPIMATKDKSEFLKMASQMQVTKTWYLISLYSLENDRAQQWDFLPELRLATVRQ